MEELGGNESVATATSEAPTAPPLPAYGHAPFLGTFRMKLPANGRVVLPSTLRRAFADKGMIRPVNGRFLNLYTPFGFQVTVDEMMARARDGLIAPRSRKRMFTSSTEVSIDSQGRLVLSKELRDAVGVGADGRVVVAGAIEAIEIWPEDRYDEEELPTLSDADLFLDNFEGLDS